jgi:hypothetical protein
MKMLRVSPAKEKWAFAHSFLRVSPQCAEAKPKDKFVCFSRIRRFPVDFNGSQRPGIRLVCGPLAAAFPQEKALSELFSCRL